MVIYIGADHKGFELKEFVKRLLQELGYSVTDMGNTVHDPNDDYPVFAAAVAEKVGADYENARGVLVCGSGVGVCVAANKFPRIRAALVTSADQAFDSRNDDDANVLCLASTYTQLEEVKRILVTWLSTPFSGEARHRRRIEEVAQLEQ